MRTSMVILGFVCWSAAAAAAPERIDTQTAPADPQEQAFAKQLAKALQLKDGTVKKRRFFWKGGKKGATSTGAPLAHPIEVRGVVVDLDGVQVERLRFATEKNALTFLSYTDIGMGKTDEYRLVEGRGNQVVILTGRRLDDAEFAARSRKGSWQGLNTPKEKLVLAVSRGHRDLAIETVPRGPAFEMIKGALAKGRKRRSEMERPDSKVHADWRSENSFCARGADFTADIDVGEDLATYSSATGKDHAKREGQIRQYIKTAKAEKTQPEPNKLTATEKAFKSPVSVLNGLF